MQAAERHIEGADPAMPSQCPEAADSIEAAAIAWGAVERSLSPVIGRRGVAALCRRSIQLTSAAYPWLARADGMAPSDDDVDALRARIRNAPVAEALAGHVALLQSFGDLLSRLIGAPLASRLMQTATRSGIVEEASLLRVADG